MKYSGNASSTESLFNHSSIVMADERMVISAFLKDEFGNPTSFGVKAVHFIFAGPFDRHLSPEVISVRAVGVGIGEWSAAVTIGVEGSYTTFASSALDRLSSFGGGYAGNFDVVDARSSFMVDFQSVSVAGYPTSVGVLLGNNAFIGLQSTCELTSVGDASCVPGHCGVLLLSADNETSAIHSVAVSNSRGHTYSAEYTIISGMSHRKEEQHSLC